MRIKLLLLLIIPCLLFSGCQQDTLADKIDSKKIGEASEEIIKQATQSAAFKETEAQITQGIKENIKRRIDQF